MSAGSLTVLSGPMFAGKTDTFIAMALSIAEEDRKVYYPEIDTRYESGFITAHNGKKIAAVPVDLQLERVAPSAHIFIDEAQFLCSTAAEKVMELVRGGAHVVLSGLDLDYRESPFGLMPFFMAKANKVLKITGKCAQCGEPSTRTYRKVGKKKVVLVGGEEAYEPRCLTCYLAGTSLEKHHD